jgi:hypothetical protein
LGDLTQGLYLTNLWGDDIKEGTRNTKIVDRINGWAKAEENRIAEHAGGQGRRREMMPVFFGVVRIGGKTITKTRDERLKLEPVAISG